MALYHLSVTETKRSAGQSAIASAAYRAGERLYSEYYGEYSDYTRKGGLHIFRLEINIRIGIYLGSVDKVGRSYYLFQFKSRMINLV